MSNSQTETSEASSASCSRSSLWRSASSACRRSRCSAASRSARVDRGREALQAALQHVIGGAGLDAFDRLVFAQGAGHHDDRRVGLALARRLSAARPS